MIEMLLVALVKSVLIAFILLTAFAYTTLLERKVVGRIQARVGPNRVGPYGLLQPLADGIKLAFKEDFFPSGSDRIVFTLAPIVSVVCAVSAFAVIPVGGEISLFGVTTDLVLADVNIGVLYLLGVTSLSVYGVMLAGWSSNNKFALLGGVRSSAQVISYELALGLSLIGVMLLTGSLRLTDIVEAQTNVWFIFLQPLGFFIYVIAGIAETNRAPFDLPEAEQELTAGYHTEYTGMKFAMFYMAEYINMVTVSAVASTLFLGGYQGPFGLASGPHWLALKIAAFLFVYIWIRATLPRFRYDQLMRFGWRVLLPLALLNVLLTAIGTMVLG